MPFGAKPLSGEIVVGTAAAKRSGQDRCVGDARVVLGTWFDGLRKQSVEELVFLTPGHLSRWIGYGLGKGESFEDSQKMWDNFSALSKGKMLGVIRLARLCSVDIGDMDVRPDASPEALDTVKIRFRRVSSSWKEINFRVFQDVQDRDPLLVWRESWDRALASVMTWPSQPSEFPLVSEIRWGKNRLITSIAEFPMTEPQAKCELEITEVGRKRVVPFKFPKN
jgi:hypothetical protein